ncbi:hypothetical protein SBF1_8130003 [Candidatus Desulfosporosinus infrequens]|uniref:Major tropism determinant N-terminal domain-containing protein n=1 Tax=Candidatus Desulfosporosinus infrequens TaxID=2043169 RepID=A0A2U3LTU0_9FIRM|nr:hypothetical protein SBF1_8130003 [Candidatus Desulfosporosinus infrequens]
MATIRIKRGLAANLPASANPGELVLALDTGVLYSGNAGGTGLIQLNGVGSLPNATTSNAGLMSAADKTSLNTLVSAGSSSFTYYNPGVANCFVLASGSGVTLSQASNVFTFAAFPAGVIVISATIAIPASVTSGGNFYIIMPTAYGAGAGYIMPMVQVVKDVGGARGTIGTISYNVAQNEISVTGLSTSLAYVCHISF